MTIKQGACISQQIIHPKQEIISLTTSNNYEQKSLESHIEKRNVVEADIWWVPHAVISDLSGNSSDKIENLFKVMFQDSRIAKDFHIGRKKI